MPWTTALHAACCPSNCSISNTNFPNCWQNLMLPCIVYVLIHTSRLQLTCHNVVFAFIFELLKW
jgi:hypothetical protein